MNGGLAVPSEKAIIGSLLLRELIAIRTDTLWRMLSYLQQGQLPEINEEGATGKLDNKGAIFIPGGLIYQDVEENQIAHEPLRTLTEAGFREKIRASMQYDNATLMFPDGLANGVNLDSGFFTRASRRIYTFKRAAFKRKKRIGRKNPLDINSNDIIRSHSPNYMHAPYGARTRISTCVSIGLTGLIRILGIGRFGEFSTFSLERLNKQLTREMKRKN
jgi:hypothetical protein